MSIPVRQSTAFECSIGPVLDADGVAVTGCVVGDFKIKKTTGNFAALNGSATLTHVSAGVYDLVLTTSDTDTVGLATIAIDDTTNACASVHLQVMEEAVYDMLYAASALGYVANAPVSVAQWSGSNVATPSVAGVPEVDVTHIGGDAQSATDLKDFADAGYDPSTNKVQGVVLTDTLTTYTGNTPQTGDSYAIVNHGTNGNAAIKTQVAAIETDTQDIQSRIPAALVNSRMDCTIDGTGMESGAVAAIRDEMDNNSAKLASILEDTAELQMDWVNGGRLDLIIDNVNTLVTGNDAYLSDLDSRIPAALTGDGNMKADALRINGQLTSAAATVTFPATLASTTNITAGTITTVTNLTNAPTSGDLTSTMKDSVETAVTTALGGTDVTDFTAIPSGTPNVLEALGFLYAQGFYRKEQTATTTTLFDGDNVAVAEATTSDDGTTFVRTKFTAP